MSRDDVRAARQAKRGPIEFDIEVNPVDDTRVALGDDVVGAPGPRRPVDLAGSPARWCRHNKIHLALHHLRVTDEVTPRLLVLHGLGEATPAAVPPAAATWPGEVWGLDFTGHGHSTIPRGGGYTAEILMGDVDAALAELGPCTVLGRGLGGYVALLIAGARPGLVRGAALTDGPGLVGGGIGPGAPRVTVADPGNGPPDPYALAELSIDLRPPDYALTYLHLALQRSMLDEPVSVCGVVRPPWLEAIVGEPGVRVESAAEALARFLSAST